VFLLHKNSSLLFLPLVEKELRQMIATEQRHIKQKEKLMAGRPRKAIKREAATGVRFTKAEYFIVKQKAGTSGLKLTEYIRKMAIEGMVTARLNEEERNFIRQLIGMANNLNQLTKKAHQEGMLIAILHFERYRNEIDQLLRKLKDHDQ
jgi:hypothetical protein